MDQYVYLAGPISGLKYAEATDWRKSVRDDVPYWIKTLSPLRAKEYLSNQDKIADSYSETIMSSAKAINTRDYNDVQHSAAVFVNLLGAKKVSIGTVMEIAWAKTLAVPVICVMEKDNIHRHCMLEDACGIITENLKDGIEALINLLGTDEEIVEHQKAKKSLEDIEQTMDTLKKWAETSQPIEINPRPQYPKYRYGYDPATNTGVFSVEPAGPSWYSML